MAGLWLFPFSLLPHRFFPQSVDHMADSHQWMMKKHPGAGKSHNSPYFFSHFRFVAVDSAVAAGRFPFLERAIGQSQQGVIQQFLAFAAEFSFCGAMFLSAVKGNHFRNGPLFSPHSFVHYPVSRSVLSVHSFSIYIM